MRGERERERERERRDGGKVRWGREAEWFERRRGKGSEGSHRKIWDKDHYKSERDTQRDRETKRERERERERESCFSLV